VAKSPPRQRKKILRVNRLRANFSDELRMSPIM